jgi:uncharacterized protein (TIGR03067 family)
MKSRLVRFVGLIASVFVLFHSYGVSAEDSERIDAKSLEGTWKIVFAELSGQRLPEAVTKEMRLLLQDGAYTLKSNSPDDKGTVKYDLTKKIPEMDILGEDGPNKGRKILAIFAVEGEQLVVCYDLEGKKRPTEFKTSAETKHFLVRYERVPK